MESLALGGTKITDAGLVQLAKLSQLKYLYLARTQVTVVGLSRVDGMPKLEVLNFDAAQNLDAARKSFYETHPKLRDRLLTIRLLVARFNPRRSD